MESIINLSFFLALFSAVLAHPSANSMNPQPIQNNQLSVGEQQQPGTNMKSGEQMQPVGQYIYRTNPNNQAAPYMQNYPANNNYNAGYARDVMPPQPQPFFGLSSNGEFQLSAYFSQIFWGFVAVIVGVAAIIWLIRLFFPKESIGSMVQKIKESGTARAIDLDRLTNLVYGAFDSYGKWAAKDTRDSSGNHPKRR